MVTSPLIKRMSAVFGVYVRRPINTDTILMESTRFLLLAPLKKLAPRFIRIFKLYFRTTAAL